MSSNTIVQAWKNPALRNILSEAERAALPANPAGLVEISDEDLGRVAGGGPARFPPTEICSCMCTMGCL